MQRSHSFRGRHLLPIIVLTLLTCSVYGRAVSFDFLSNWDDYQYITGNPDIRGFSPGNLIRIFSSVYVGNYAPLHLLSYLVDYQFAGLNSAWFHGVNILIHAANGALFYLLVERLTGRRLWGVAAAAVFLLHPAQVESVAWVTERKNLLAMLFSLASFHGYVTWRRGSGTEQSRGYALALVFLVCALLTKSIAVIMPVVYFLYDICVEKVAIDRKSLARYLPLVAVVAVASGITLYTQSAEMGGGSLDFFAGDQKAKILTMLPVLTAYLKILCFPVPANLNSIYIFPIRTAVDGPVLFSLAIVALLLAAGAVLWRRDRVLFFGFALFFLGLVPVSQIVPLATLMNDRYLYFPLLGAAWLLGGVVTKGAAALGEKGGIGAATVVAVLALLLGGLSFQRAAVWHDAVTLWGDVVGKLPELKDPRAALAAAYLYDGRKREALRTYEEVFGLKRDFTEPMAERKALLEAARLYLELGPAEKALALLQELTRKFPDYPPGFGVLGQYHQARRDYPAAEKAYRSALDLDPRSPVALISLGTLCLETGRLDEARRFYEQCYENGGNSPDLQYNMGCVEARAGNPAQALRHLEEALRLGYRNYDALVGNPELVSLQKLPAFQGLLQTYFPANR